jgi:hypothetical protein
MMTDQPSETATESESTLVSFIEPGDTLPEYLTTLGQSAKGLSGFRAGWLKEGAPYPGRLAVPLYGAGDVFQGAAAYEQGGSPEWVYLYDFDPTKHLFNLDRVMESEHPYVVLVTSIFDCIAVARLGYNVVATLEPGISAEQEQLLREKLADSSYRSIRKTNLQITQLKPRLKHFTIACTCGSEYSVDQSGSESFPDVRLSSSFKLWFLTG